MGLRIALILPAAPCTCSSLLTTQEGSHGLGSKGFLLSSCGSHAIQALFGWHTRLCTMAASCGVLCSILECLQWYFEQLVTSPAWSYPNELLNCFLLVEYWAKCWKKVDTCRLYWPRPVSENLLELGPQDLPQTFPNTSHIDLDIVNFLCCCRKHASHKHPTAIQRNRGPNHNTKCHNH